MERGNQQCAMLLIEAGADPNIKDFFGDLPVFTPKPIPKEYLDHIYAPFGKWKKNSLEYLDHIYFPLSAKFWKMKK